MSTDALVLGILTIVAIVLAPVIAVQVSQWIADYKEIKKRRFDIFRNLMATRAAGLSYIHVESLNRIEIEFYGKDNKSQAVVEAWKVYLDFLNNTKPTDVNSDWINKKGELVTDLLQKMAVCLGYNFDKVNILRGHYYPQGYSDIEMEQSIIRKTLAEILQLKKPFPPILAFVTPTEKEKIDEVIAVIKANQ